MKSKLYCRSHHELAGYLRELTTYFKRYGLIPGKSGYVALPNESVFRMRFDEKSDGSSISIVFNWEVEGGLTDGRSGKNETDI